MLYESVYQNVRGNYERAAAAMKAMAGRSAPAEIESVTTPVPGQVVQSVCVLVISIC